MKSDGRLLQSEKNMAWIRGEFEEEEEEEEEDIGSAAEVPNRRLEEWN
ncbi:MAG: hypothetical protein PHF93_05665 [Acidobacteriota bacterium]|jgi:hypothetical protein|nr:hypothetical protein [Acidobacteriota bacterium]MDD8033291.1 hypothetical protein [Acidobacteriota bacterium]MDD8038093.1 hypothetical protein [Acidobacteriota bacterium]MDW3225887.1 hypothetical protein [Acidobacteriota bacterium]